jgi:hypothetical protein
MTSKTPDKQPPFTGDDKEKVSPVATLPHSVPLTEGEGDVERAPRAFPRKVVDTTGGP